jgi:ribosome biogenesis GTPase
LIDIEHYGFDSFYKNEFEAFKDSGFEPGRITAEHKQRYNVVTRHGEITGEVTGRFLYDTDDSSDFPKTGDWTAVTYFEDDNKCIIHNLLKRRSQFTRGQAGRETGQQVIAANIDYIFIVQSYNRDFSINRIERYMIMAEEGNCEPVVIINKNDLADNPGEFLERIRKRLKDIPLFSISCETGNGFNNLKEFIEPGKTYALAGSSGVGKSSIINLLMNNTLQKTAEIRIGDGRGKHTTTRRELFLLPGGGIIIDTPGMREFSIRNSDVAGADIYSDIAEIAEGCRFKDCSHMQESGCAVKEALANGIITEEHLENYFKLKKESDYLDSLIDKNIYLERKKKEKELHRIIKRYYKNGNSKGNI